MSIKICSLGSGSKGNCTLISSGNCKILVDAGIAFSNIKRLLSEIGEDVKDINAVVVTHEHSDHILSLDKLHGEGIPVYAHVRAQQAILKKTGPIDFVKEDFYDGGFMVEDILVRPFRLPHDACYPLGYSFECGGDKVSVATDIGHVTDGVIDNLAGSRIVLLEANHDRELLLHNPKYPAILKKRIDGMRGHLSNDDAAAIARKILSGKLERLILAHLSEKNNSPELAFSAVVEGLTKEGVREGRDLTVEVALQHCRTAIF